MVGGGGEIEPFLSNKLCLVAVALSIRPLVHIKCRHSDEFIINLVCRTSEVYVRLEVIAVVTRVNAFLWHVTSYDLVELHPGVGRRCCLRVQGGNVN
jgi:hypothetical protein